MIMLRQTLETARDILTTAQIDYALIGGFALSAHGIHRATKDINLLVHGSKKEEVKKLFIQNGFSVFYESSEVLQLTGIGYLDIVFANRPISLSIIQKSKNNKKLLGVPVVSREAIIASHD